MLLILSVDNSECTYPTLDETATPQFMMVVFHARHPPPESACAIFVYIARQRRIDAAWRASASILIVVYCTAFAVHEFAVGLPTPSMKPVLTTSCTFSAEG